MDFASPSTGGEGISAAEVEGHLLVVEPTEYVQNVVTVHGPKDAVRCVVHDINEQVTYDNCLWFGGYLVGGLKGQIGKRVLGVMAKGVAKPGQSAPWQLNDAAHNEDAVKAATAYLNGLTAKTLSAPAQKDEPAAAAGESATLDAALANLAAAGLAK